MCMELNWTHNQAENLLKCVIFSNKYNQELYYTTKDGGQVIKKYFIRIDALDYLNISG